MHFAPPLPFSRHHLSNDDSLEDKRGNYQNSFVLRQLYTMIPARVSSSYAVGLGLVFVCLLRLNILCFSVFA